MQRVSKKQAVYGNVRRLASCSDRDCLSLACVPLDTLYNKLQFQKLRQEEQSLKHPVRVCFIFLLIEKHYIKNENTGLQFKMVE